MATSMTAKQILDREFLELRGKILEIAASFDRLERADGDVQGDPRISLLHEALQVLEHAGEDRAEQVQIIFSRQYDQSWRDKFGLFTVRKAK